MEPEFIGGEVDLRINIYRGQNDTNNARINAKKTKNGVNDIKNGIDGVKISRTKEQVQIEKLLQAIEKNPFATQVYAEQIGVSKRTVSRIFVFFTAKWCVGTKWNKQKIELGNHKVGETEECKYWSMQMPVR